MAKEVKQWITVKGRHIPIFEGETIKDAVKRMTDKGKEHRPHTQDSLRKKAQEHKKAVDDYKKAPWKEGAAEKKVDADDKFRKESEKGVIKSAKFNKKESGKESKEIDTDKLFKVVDKYNTSTPVSGSWDTETAHEQRTIANEFGISMAEAKRVMIDKLGFPENDKWAKDVPKSDSKSAKIDNDRLMKVINKYNSSTPVSGNWETETAHEQQTIAKEFGISLAEAKKIMTDKLGFSEDDKWAKDESKKSWQAKDAKTKDKQILETDMQKAERNNDIDSVVKQRQEQLKTMPKQEKIEYLESLIAAQDYRKKQGKDTSMVDAIIEATRQNLIEEDKRKKKKEDFVVDYDIQKALDKKEAKRAKAREAYAKKKQANMEAAKRALQAGEDSPKTQAEAKALKEKYGKKTKKEEASKNPTYTSRAPEYYEWEAQRGHFSEADEAGNASLSNSQKQLLRVRAKKAAGKKAIKEVKEAMKLYGPRRDMIQDVKKYDAAWDKVSSQFARGEISAEDYNTIYHMFGTRFHEGYKVRHRKK